MEADIPESLLEAMVDAYNAVQSPADRGYAQQEMGMQAALQVYLDNAAQLPASAPSDTISREEWIAQARAFYIESGDDPKTADELARYLCNEQDWAGEEIGDPREAAQEDVQGRPRPASAPSVSVDEPAWWAAVMGAAADLEQAANGITHDADAKRSAIGAAAFWRKRATELAVHLSGELGKSAEQGKVCEWRDLTDGVGRPSCQDFIFCELKQGDYCQHCGGRVFTQEQGK